MAKFFIVMESKHVTAADRMTQFYMRTFLRNNPSFSNQGSKDDSRLVLRHSLKQVLGGC